MNKYKTVAQAEAKILKLEEKQRNLQQNFDAQAHGNRQRVRQYEAEIDRLKAELAKPRTGRTITESEHRKLIAGASPNYGAGFIDGFWFAGGEVIPATEPTNAEKLADVYRDWYGGDEVPNSLIQFMDQAGVTAPEEK